MSLDEISSINAERRNGDLTRERSLGIMRRQLGHTEEKLAAYEALAAYLRAKIAWQESGGRGTPPMLQRSQASATIPTERPLSGGA